MAGRRIANTLPIGATVLERNKTLWTKIDPHTWEEPSHGEQLNNAGIDIELARGAEVAYVRPAVETELAKFATLDAGEYIVLPHGWWSGEMKSVVNADERIAHHLWRVAGWLFNDPHNMCVLVDAPPDRQQWVNHLMCVEGSWEVEGLRLYLRSWDEVAVVLPGQDHETWEAAWDWTYEFEFVDPPQ